MTRPTSSPSESIAVLKVSTMDAEYQTKRPSVRPTGASFNPWEGAYALSKRRSRRSSPDAYGSPSRNPLQDRPMKDPATSIEKKLGDADALVGPATPRCHGATG